MFIIKTNEQREKARTALLEQGSAMCTLHVAGADILPSRAEYEGVDEKGREVSASGGSDAPVLIELTSYDDALEFASEPLSVDISISRGGENVFTGSQEYYADFVPPENGVYDFAIAASFEKDGAKAKCDYGFSISYDVQTKVSLSADTVAQGGTLLLIAENVRDPASLAVSVDYPYDPQIELTATGGYAYIPINYMRNAGEYSVTANYDGKTLELPFTVTETEYEVQHLTVSSSTVSSTIGSNNAYDEIAEKFYSLDSHFDPKIYWNENFIQPVEGSITTEYGIKRYTNNSSTPSRHAGIDIANAEGTPIKASNSGVVLFADELQMTGYSIMIEHG
ncbi:MAG: M23 family metallopeptidase, partial [Oscillospiraceae bacterium]